MKIKLIIAGLAAALSAASAGAVAPERSDSSLVTFGAGLINVAGKGDFAPYYLSANRHGILTQSADVVLDLGAECRLDTTRRFSWGFGAEGGAAWAESTAYQRYTAAGGWSEHDLNGRHAFLQQLYAEVKFRGVFLTVGMKSRGSALLDDRLSSGDLIESGNARSNPEVRIGFINFQNIPFTRGWVQIQGEISYGPMTDYGWLKDHFNYWSGHITEGSIRNYKRCYFRTKPDERLSVTVGAQCVTVFGGTQRVYSRGVMTSERRFSRSPRAFVEAFLPVSEGQEDFRLGNTLGSWDLLARYSLDGGRQVKAYFQWPWEDGSGIGRRNGFDGLWGLEYKAEGPGWLTGAVVEYSDFTNQGGPLHWAPADRPGTSITAPATGSDDYYNNAYYNPYANYGLSIGTPFLKAPLFNTGGEMAYLYTRQRGFHIAVEGQPTARLSYRAMVSYRKAWGNGWTPVLHPLHDTSVMLEAAYALPRVEGLRVKAAFALDHGTLLGNNSGGELTVSYTIGVGRRNR